jgi:hypothetical protein
MLDSGPCRDRSIALGYLGDRMSELTDLARLSGTVGITGTLCDRIEQLEGDLRYVLSWMDAPTLAELRKDPDGGRIVREVLHGSDT